MKRYSSAQPSLKIANTHEDQHINSHSIMFDEQQVYLTKIKREEIKIKEEWSKVPNYLLNCGKCHEENPEFTKFSAARWLENRLKKKNQDRILLKAIFMQKEQEEKDQKWKDNELGGNLQNQVKKNIGTINDNSSEKNIKNYQNSLSANPRLEKILWKKKMVNELHDINKFMNNYNSSIRQERADQKRQEKLGDLRFDEVDKKKQEQFNEQKERMNQLYKRLYGNESIAKMKANGIISELLQDYMDKQIILKDKEELPESKNENNKNQNGVKIKNQNDNLENNKSLKKEQSPFKKMYKSESMHETLGKNDHKRQNIKQTNIRYQRTQKDTENDQNNTETMTTLQANIISKKEKKHEKTRSEMQFDRIDQINKLINSRLEQDNNQFINYNFAESQAIRNLQSDQVIMDNKIRQKQIEQKFLKIKEVDDGFAFESNQTLLKSNNLQFQQNGQQGQILQNILSRQNDQNKKIIQNRSKSTGRLNQYDQKNTIQSKNNLVQNNDILYESDGDITKRSLQKEQLVIAGDEELGKDYFKYLGSKNEQVIKKQEEELKEKLKNNHSCQKIIAIKKIERVNMLQNFYEDYLNHIQMKVLNNSSQKIYVQKSEYKSLNVLNKIQRKAEIEEEEKLRKIKEEEIRNSKKKRVYKTVSSQNNIDQSSFSKNDSTKNMLLNSPKLKTSVPQSPNIKANNIAFSTAYEQNQITQEIKSLINNFSTNNLIESKRLSSNSPSNSQNKDKSQFNQLIKKDSIKEYQLQKNQQLKNIQFDQQLKNSDSLNSINNQSQIAKQIQDINQKKDQFFIILSQQSQNLENKDTSISKMKNQHGDNNQKEIQQEDQIYYTPQKVKDYLSSNLKQVLANSGNKDTTADSPDIKNYKFHSEPSDFLSEQRKCNSVGRLRNLQNSKNVSIPNLSAFDRMAIQTSQSNISNKFNINPRENSSLIKRAMDLNQKCRKESQGVQKITKNILLKQRRNIKTFTKLDNMINKLY